MKLFPKQVASIRQATRRFNFWDGSVRSGKTIASIIRWIQFVGSAPAGDLMMTGKTQGALKRNILNTIGDLVGSAWKFYPGKQEAYLFGRRIFCFGASNELSQDVIRGLTVAGAYCDEITLWPESYFRMMLSRMSAPGAQGFGTTNPDNPYHWFKKGFIDRAAELDFSHHHFHLDDNIFLDPVYVANLKLEYIGLWRKRFIDGLWVMAEGAVFDFFDEEVHCIRTCPKAVTYVVGIDYGTNNPTTFGLYGINPQSRPKIWLEREYYYDSHVHQRQKTDRQYAKDFAEWLGPIRPYMVICDPSAASFIQELHIHYAGSITPADNAVLDGIRTHSRMLASGEFAIYYKCQQSIKDYSAYAWDPKAALRGEDRPLKINDHTQDRSRYVLHTLYGNSNFVDYSRLTTM